MATVRVNHSGINVNASQHNSSKVNNSNVKLVKGDTGAVYIPHVDDMCNLSWSNDADLENPPTVNIRGRDGDAVVTAITNTEIELMLGG